MTLNYEIKSIVTHDYINKFYRTCHISKYTTVIISMHELYGKLEVIKFYNEKE